MTSTGTPSTGWAIRAHAAFEWVFWAVQANALWYVFTLAGGVLLGAAPATVAVAALTRRRLRGEVFPVLRTFAGVWRDEFRGANFALTPVLLVTALLGASLTAALRAGQLGTPAGLAVLVAFIIAFAVAAVAGPLYAHYELPIRQYALTAVRWSLRQPLHAFVLLLAGFVVATVSTVLPGLIPFLSLGAWLVIDTVLCIGLFTANDRRVGESSSTPV